MSERYGLVRTARMLKGTLLLVVAAGVCAGATCTIRFPGVDGNPGGSSTYVPLDQADAVITLLQSADGAEADVTAALTRLFGQALELENGQAVSVNGETLTGPASDGTYRGSVDLADEYVVSVNEPTRGVEETTIGSPGGFDITAPAAGADASLSGFALRWSNADASFDVLITLTQTLFGSEVTQDFGPFTDTGTQSLDAQDLIDFRQGADLLITVTRVNERESIAGFSSGVLTVEHAVAVSVVPAP